MVLPRLRSPEVRAGLSEQAAAGLIEKHGVSALPLLRERAEMAEKLGHRVAASTWREMAEAAARLLRVDPTDRDPAWPGTWFGTYEVSRGSHRRGVGNPDTSGSN